MLENIESVTREEVQIIAQEFIKTDNVALAMLGRLGDTEVTREDLAC